MFPWVEDIIPMVANHGLVPRNVLEVKSKWPKRLGSESDKVQHNSRLELQPELEWSWSGGARDSRVGSEMHWRYSGVHWGCIRGRLEYVGH